MAEDLACGNEAGLRVAEVVDVLDEGAVKVELSLRSKSEGRMRSQLFGKARCMEDGVLVDGLAFTGFEDAEWCDPGEFVVVDGADDCSGHTGLAHDGLQFRDGCRRC